MISCVIVDDEPLAVELLSDFVRKVSFLDLQASFISPLKALEQIEEKRPQLLFLDIHMGDMSGIELIKALSYRPGVVFTTGYAEHALEGYQLDVIDYLLKPIALSRFMQAATRARARIQPAVTSIASPSGRPAEFIFIKSEYKTVKINLEEIIYIEGLKDYTKIYLKGHAKPVLTLQNLKSFESKLPPRSFIRVHRSYIVAVNRISSISRNRIVVEKHEVPVSTGFRDNVQQIVGDHS